MTGCAVALDARSIPSVLAKLYGLAAPHTVTSGTGEFRLRAIESSPLSRLFLPLFNVSSLMKNSILSIPQMMLPVLLGLMAALGMGSAHGQAVSLTTQGSAYTQNFDTLSNTAGSTTNNLTITGWFMTETGGGARDNEQ